MPYVNYLFCEKCGPPAKLDIDSMETLGEYIADGRKGAYIDDRVLIWDYLIYRCNICRSAFRYTYIDVERRVREYFSTLAQAQREYVEKVAEMQADHAARKTGAGFIDWQQKTRDRLKEMYQKD